MRYPFARLVLTPLGLGAASFVYFLRFPRPKGAPQDVDNDLFTSLRAEYLAQLQTSALVRSLLIHSFCTHPRLVDLGVKIATIQNGPISLLDSFVRQTFFKHFCGYLR